MMSSELTNVEELEDDVPYGYGFFHFIFATGSMYFGMPFVGWDTHHIMKEKWSVDISWTSTWVHIVNESLTVIFFVAILVARIYGIGWLRQLPACLGTCIALLLLLVVILVGEAAKAFLMKAPQNHNDENEHRDKHLHKPPQVVCHRHCKLAIV